ncbi:hypothetical protein [Streptomyces radicis]|nr:hypothetical protein [Streptomyces radicis]
MLNRLGAALLDAPDDIGALAARRDAARLRERPAGGGRVGAGR